MKELAYHILDIANNSVRGKAESITISIEENRTGNHFELVIEDDGVGIPGDVLKTIKDPFTTSRTMRKVGLGIPFLNDTCMNCNGGLKIESTVGEGTKVTASMELDHIDRPPMGNLASTITTLITSEEQINITYRHSVDDEAFEVSTSQLKEVLGDVPLKEVEVVIWLKDFLKTNLEAIHEG